MHYQLFIYLLNNIYFTSVYCRKYDNSQWNKTRYDVLNLDGLEKNNFELSNFLIWSIILKWKSGEKNRRFKLLYSNDHWLFIMKIALVLLPMHLFDSLLLEIQYYLKTRSRKKTPKFCVNRGDKVLFFVLAWTRPMNHFDLVVTVMQPQSL